MEFLNRNLKILALTHPEIFQNVKSLITKNDIYQNKVSERSGRNAKKIILPELESEAVHLIVFAGIGTGGELCHLYQNFPMLSKIVVVEPSSLNFVTALCKVDLSQIFKSSRVALFVGKFDEAEFKTALQPYVYFLDSVVYVPSVARHPRLYRNLQIRLTDIVRVMRAAGKTTAEYGPACFRNRLSNMRLLDDNSIVESLVDTWKGKPALLVSAGPSLDQSLHLIRQFKGKALIIAVDAALASLKSVSIEPDIITMVDYSILNFEKLAPFLDCTKDFLLVSLLTATPEALRRVKSGNTVFAFKSDKFEKRIGCELGIRHYLSQMLSVAHLSLFTALITGADPVIFVGQDLALTGTKFDHAEAAVVKNEMDDMDGVVYAEGIGGSRVKTTSTFLNFRTVFEEIITDNPDVRFINSTAGGLRLKGAEEIPLQDAFDSFVGDRPRDRWHHDLLRETPDKKKEFLSIVSRLYGELLELSARLSSVGKMRGELLKFLSRDKSKSLKLRSAKQLPKQLQKLMQRLDAENAEIDAMRNLWQVLEELTFPSFAEAARLQAECRLLRNSSYGNWLVAEYVKQDLIHRKRKAALQEACKLLNAELDYYRTFAELKEQASRDDRKRYSVVTFLLEHRNIAKAAYILERQLDRTRFPEAVRIYECCIKIGYLQYGDVAHCWELSQSVSSELHEMFASFLRKEAKVWISALEEELGHSMMGTWLERIFHLMPDRTGLMPDVLRLWDRTEEKLINNFDREELDPCGKMLKAWEVFKKHIPQWDLWWGRYLLRTRQIHEAVIHLSACHESDPSNTELMALLAQALLEAGEFDQGIRLLDAAVSMDPEYAILWVDIGDALFQNKDYEGAISAYENCFTVLPQRWDILVKIGDCYLMKGIKDAARAAYEEVLKHVPDAEDVKKRLENIAQH